MAVESIVKEAQHSPRGRQPLPRCQSLQSRRSRSWLGSDSAGVVVGLKMLSLGRVQVLLTWHLRVWYGSE